MPCQILIAAIEKPGVTGKGYPWIIKDEPCVWGGKEGPPNWVILRIPDATKAQVEHFLDSWKKEFSHSILNENELGYRIMVEVDSDFISASGANKEVKAAMRDYLVNEWGAVIHSYEDWQVVFDIAKPVDLQELKAAVYDRFSERVDTRMYYFSSDDVDWALTQPGGMGELTKAQTLDRIINKLDE